MTFVLRQVTRRASGAEIVRERVLDAAEPRIGRGTDCDIRLPDLAVSLHHATLRMVGPGRVAIESAAREPFGLDGRFLTRAEVDVAKEPRLLFGDHVLTLSPGEAGAVLINLARTEPTTGDAYRSGPAAGVTPPAKVFGRRRMAWTFGLGILLLCLLWPLAAFYGHFQARIDPDRQWSSGPLSTAHAFLEDDCQACHQQAFVAVRDNACMSCHLGDRSPATRLKAARMTRAAGSLENPSFIRDHAPRHRILWGAPPPDHFGGKAEAWFRRTFNRPGQRCASCHREHVANPAAGQPPEPTPLLTPTQTCVQCHTGLSRRLERTDLIDAPDWTGHPDLRPTLPGRTGARRVSMSERPREASGLTFPHRLHLSPTAGPARMARSLGGRGYGAALTCANCHRPDVSGKGFAPVQMDRDCAACHSLDFALPGGDVRRLPHGHPAQVLAALRSWIGAGGPAVTPAPGAQRRRPGASGEDRRPASAAAGAASVTALGGAFGRGGACFDCHTLLRSPTLAVLPVRLPQTFLSRGAFDHRVAAHRVDSQGRPACGRCHEATASDTATDLLLPGIAECAECHGRLKAQEPQAASADCGTCHSFHAPARPTPRPTKPALVRVAWPRPGPTGQTTP